MPNIAILLALSSVLTGPEVASITQSGALVDTAALKLWFNFDAPPGPGVTLFWQCTDAILQSADVITGPFVDVPGVTSPFSAAAQGSRKFYRYRGHTPVSVVSNPFLM